MHQRRYRSAVGADGGAVACRKQDPPVAKHGTGKARRRTYDQCVSRDQRAGLDRATITVPSAEGFEAPLWRALAVFRAAALAYSLILIIDNDSSYKRPGAAWIVLGVLAAWTAITIRLYAQPRARRWPLYVADLAVLAGCLLASRPVINGGSIGSGHSLPGVAVAGGVLAWAIALGRWGGTIAALLIGGADLTARGGITQNSLNNAILLLLAAIAVGHVSQLGIKAQQRLAEAAKLEAATRTRERLARDIHDSVLQVLALVARRAQQLGGEAAELGQLAGEQEAALRALIGSAGAATTPDGLVDLCTALDRFASPTITIATPATMVGLPEGVRDEILAAVGSALDNVIRHAGDDAHAWVLLEDDPETVIVTVRDDGVGIASGRLDAAVADGRLGVTQSINGRMRDLGGTALISSQPGEGTEIELRIPRQRP
jgi:signal transduction histidine kinase